MNMNILWRMLTVDPRAAEFGTALIGVGVAISCLAGDWFGGWLPAQAHLAPYAILIGGVGLLFSATHCLAVWMAPARVRQVYAAINMATLASLGSALIGSYGIGVPGSAAFPIGSMIQLWIICALEIRRLDE